MTRILRLFTYMAGLGLVLWYFGIVIERMKHSNTKPQSIKYGDKSSGTNCLREGPVVDHSLKLILLLLYANSSFLYLILKRLYHHDSIREQQM